MLSGLSIASARTVELAAETAVDSEKICGRLRGMLPVGVCVAAGAAVAAPLTARENLSLGPADAEQARQFVSGRAYAKRALAKLGVHSADLPISAQPRAGLAKRRGGEHQSCPG